jgi:hypothetical protein
LFASPCDIDKASKPKGIPIKDLHFNMEDYSKSNMSLRLKMNDFVEHQNYIIQLTKTEMVLIEATTSATGTTKFDLPPQLAKQEGPDKPRKDSYTVALLGSWGFECFLAMKNAKIKKRKGIKPRFIV